ncbi:hypothetical protein QG053_08255 [Kingella kingae]|nr:hypothetical protein [Kingella kingae]MDK4536814.1 hypothetical protein [Kingella kingae]MDK4565027.1 hypothetical protein [Kingella kingae]
MPTPLCTSCTRRSLSPCPNLNLKHYTKKNHLKKQPALFHQHKVQAALS